MNTILRLTQTTLRHTALWLAGLLATTCIAAPSVSRAEWAQIEARLTQERAVCVEGRSHQDTKTCLQEVRGAQIEARRGGLEGNPAAYPSNRLQRCEALAGDDKRDCIARIQGGGTTEGSVAGGGILRMLVTREVVPVPLAAEPAANPASAASR